MANTKAQVFDSTTSTHALLGVVKEEKEQCFTNAYITSTDDVKEMLKRKYGGGPYRVQVCQKPRNGATVQRVPDKFGSTIWAT
jgi:hypothetical protein